ncbi:antitoxin Xre/MbcA/ParS toxin-binding domain-containing protein [Roseivirga sp.]|uniref:antitoxin Xre/MbcA/ParS toxin-binding domain-containing protein n=1 Tax=Roseivirga sp. TaxID=1964215 RepID=UPI003B518D3B
MGSEYTIPDIPQSVAEEAFVAYLVSTTIDSNFVPLIKNFTTLSDEVISDCLNINVKTYRSYRDKTVELKPIQQEHTLAILSVLQHGIRVFGNKEKLTEWLEKPNFFFDNRPPLDFLKTISGIQFIDHKLSAIESGDTI